MEQKINEININGVEYVTKDSIARPYINVDDLKMVMIRTYSAGVHYGFLKKRESTLAGMEVELIDARRVWYWEGAATLNQLSIEGTSKPDKCKFPCRVTSIQLVAIEIIEMTKKAVKSLNSVKIWKM